MGDEAASNAPTAVPIVADAEISSADPEMRQLLISLRDINSPVSLITSELRRVFQVNHGLVRDYYVPYSGMPVIFYIAQRLYYVSSSLPVSLEEEVASLFRASCEEFGADANSLDSVMRQNVMFYTAKAGSLRCCKELWSLGCSCSLTDVHNQTALFYAAREGRTDVVEWLVREGGCLINQVDKNCQTALFYAAREDRFECVCKMVNDLGADPLVRDIYKKRARAYLKGPNQRRTFDFLTEVERARDPSSANLSQRKMFIVSSEPLGAASMRLRQHKPYNPHQLEDEQLKIESSSSAPKRQKSGNSTPSSNPTTSNEKIINKKEKPTPLQPLRSVSSSPVQSPSSSESLLLPTPSPANGRSRFRIKAPIGLGGLESFEKSFPEIAVWHTNGNSSPPSESPSPPKTLHRPPRTPVQSLTPSWVPVVSLLLRGPLWRYGPATIFHKSHLQLPANLGPKFLQPPAIPEMKLSIDLSVIRKKLEKGKYATLLEIDQDVRGMFQQAYDLTGGKETDLGLLTRATEIYYEQQMAGSGLAAVIRDELETRARNARLEILNRHATESNNNRV